MQFLGSKGDGGEDTGRARDDYKNDGGGRSPQRQQAAAARSATNKPKSSTGFDDMDDDIPF
jgi:single-strand DNA-binding protein